MDHIIAREVSRQYGKTEVVSQASLELLPGRLTALLGGSGAGKSTLLRLIAGLEPVDSGDIHIGKTLLSKPGKTVPAEKRRIGLVFQDFALFPHMTALQNVCFGLSKRKSQAAKTTALNWLSELGLKDRASAYPHQLSGGEQQRVAIARALAPEPAAILMDEPFSGLDPALRESVRDIALSAVRAAGIPALLVTHDASEAMMYADHLAIMLAGKIIQQGEPNAVYTQPVDVETAAALGPINHIAETSSLAPLLGAGSAVREEAVQIDRNGPVRGAVKSVRQMGGLASIVFDIYEHGPLRARIETRGLQIGDICQLSFDPALVFRFGQNL